MSLRCYTVKSLRNGGRTAKKYSWRAMHLAVQAHSPPARYQVLVKHFDGVNFSVAVVVDFHFMSQ